MDPVINALNMARLDATLERHMVQELDAETFGAFVLAFDSDDFDPPAIEMRDEHDGWTWDVS